MVGLMENFLPSPKFPWSMCRSVISQNREELEDGCCQRDHNAPTDEQTKSITFCRSYNGSLLAFSISKHRLRSLGSRLLPFSLDLFVLISSFGQYVLISIYPTFL